MSTESKHCQTRLLGYQASEGDSGSLTSHEAGKGSQGCATHK